jgi:hypothetical protein
MSKRHTTSRRRSYGRRQHEIHERMDRRHDRRAERAWRMGHGIEPATFESQAADASFGYAD